MKHFGWSIPAAFALAIAVSATTAAAQGKSGGHGNHGGGQGDVHAQHPGNGASVEHAHGSQVHRSGGTVVTTRTHAARRTTSTHHTTRRRTTPPGWCLGRGNPHNTTANCGYRTDRIYRDRNGVWRDRYGNRLQTGYIYRDRTGTVRDWLGRLLR